MAIVTEEIKEAYSEINNNSLNIKDAEVELELTLVEVTYVDDDHSRESNERDIVGVEVPSQPCDISRSVMDSEQVLKVDGETNNIVFQSPEVGKQVIEELERKSGGGSYTSTEASQESDGQIITDSNEKVDTNKSFLYYEVAWEREGSKIFNPGVSIFPIINSSPNNIAES